MISIPFFFFFFLSDRRRCGSSSLLLWIVVVVLMEEGLWLTCGGFLVHVLPRDRGEPEGGTFSPFEAHFFAANTTTGTFDQRESHRVVISVKSSDTFSQPLLLAADYIESTFFGLSGLSSSFSFTSLLLVSLSVADTRPQTRPKGRLLSSSSGP